MGMDNPCGLTLDMSRSGLTVPGRQHPTRSENTRKWPGNKIRGRIPLPMVETALKANVCRKAVSRALKEGVMHDPWITKIEERRSDSTLRGQDSVEGGCSAEIGFIGVQRKRNDVHGLSRAVLDQDLYVLDQLFGI
ncbi:hypothetical protein F2Q70_00026038 [Brassica cretica]|uniref:Uncharacterized protein n=1 Tax=Brassica cretica TaxID=69181 RepID=A0A8S9H2E2_BRACR|nr:hypothetical protein F2Q68_00035580 [Brassica cretica]KAF2604355.1 hypothetical protein F2Q70_00026038 [Brassica cretica]